MCTLFSRIWSLWRFCFTWEWTFTRFNTKTPGNSLRFSSTFISMSFTTLQCKNWKVLLHSFHRYYSFDWVVTPRMNVSGLGYLIEKQVSIFRLFSETESPRILDQLFRRHLLSHVGTHPFKVNYHLKIQSKYLIEFSSVIYVKVNFNESKIIVFI